MNWRPIPNSVYHRGHEPVAIMDEAGITTGIQDLRWDDICPDRQVWRVWYHLRWMARHKSPHRQLAKKSARLWLRSYVAFCGDMGPRPAGHVLCRHDVRLPWTPDNCFWGLPGSYRHRNSFRYKVLRSRDGRHMTAEQWATELGVKVQSLQVRHRQGCKPGDPPRAAVGRTFRLNGETLTIPGIARRAGISRQAAYLRVTRGLRGRKLLETRSQRGPCKEPGRWNYSGRELTVRELAHESGLSRQLVYSRLKNGESVERALRPAGSVGRKRRTYRLNGESLTVYELSARCGLSPHVIYQRIYAGQSVEQACGLA